MNPRARRIGAVVLAALSAAVVGIGVAWACTPAAEISVSPAKGKSNDTATVSGAQFKEAPVQIHWETVNGPVIGTAQGPSFSVAVTIPDSAPGTHYLVAYQPNGGGTDTAPFTVEAQQSPDPPPEPPPTGTKDPPSNGGGSPAQGGPSGNPQGGTDDPVANGVAPAPGAAPATSPAEAGAPALAAIPDPEPSSATSAKNGARDAAAPRRGATADLWSGFAGARESNAGPGLAATPASGSGSDSLLAVGVILFSGAGLALAGGVAVAATRRRRARLD